MLEDNVQASIGQKLRAMYEEMPKGPMPDRLWSLLLLLERDQSSDAAATKSVHEHRDARNPSVDRACRG